ncbi:hypothetical protein PGH07_00065 [Sulfurovum sp. zt1-1]|uniref:Lipoprotein n=2 Tax=Sulfurovum zhangzhouensis TaxID=3019067 RepID=A0ABT7QUP4_9BACT|nr:hypothetical protein [Sulfurovum zhangzhouensis]
MSSFMLFMTGCGSQEPQPDTMNKTAQGFHTDRTYFMATIDLSSPTKEMRNAYLEEFIQKSDIQCSQYLDRSITSTSFSQSNTGLYIALFDTVSEVFGVKPLTDTAKELYRRNEDVSYETKLAYKRALSPEIKRGVEIARERYARKLLSNRYRLIESFTLPMLAKDLEKYDRLCNYDTGLVEINNILKNAGKQKKDKVTPFSPTLKIDPETIKEKVETVTKETEEKESERNSN